MSGAIALALLLVFGAVAFGLPELRRRRRSGSSWVPTAGKGGRERLADGLFAAATLLCIAGPALDLAGVLDPEPGAVATAAGVLLGTHGTLLAHVAQRRMGTAWRTGVADGPSPRLVQDGPFAAVRNPVYTGLLATVAGAVLVSPTVLAAAGALLFLAALELQVRGVEEPHLAAEHPGAFPGYAARTGRFVPGIGRRRR